MRHLASVQYVHDVTSIEGADRIELAHILGWQCVVPKGQFHVGDLGVYFEIDSYLPIEDSRYEFLKDMCYKNSSILGEGYKIKTQKMRGELSQGLLLPTTDFPEIKNPVQGLDVTELLHVRKWIVEETATSGGTIIGDLPDSVPKTDETRVQCVPELIKELGKQTYYISTKMDGSSHSISISEDDKFHVTGHNYEYKDDGVSAFYELVKERGFEEKLRRYKEINGLKSITVQGEFCAPGIQQNRMKLIKPEWFVFTVNEDMKRKGLTELTNVAKAIGATMVPIEEIGEHFDEQYPTIEAVLARSDESMYKVGKQTTKAEGIVIRPTEPVYSKTLNGPLSMKAVSNKYLLKNED